MKTFDILYYVPGDEEPRSYRVQAKTTFHAEEQLYDLVPNADVREVTEII